MDHHLYYYSPNVMRMKGEFFFLNRLLKCVPKPLLAVIGFSTWELRIPLNFINRCQNNHWDTTRQRAQRREVSSITFGGVMRLRRL